VRGLICWVIRIILAVGSGGLMYHVGSWNYRDFYTLDLHGGTTLEVKD